MAALAFTFFSFFKTFLPHAEMRGRGYSGIILKGERRGRGREKEREEERRKGGKEREEERGNE